MARVLRRKGKLPRAAPGSERKSSRRRGWECCVWGGAGTKATFGARFSVRLNGNANFNKLVYSLVQGEGFPQNVLNLSKLFDVNLILGTGSDEPRPCTVNVVGS